MSRDLSADLPAPGEAGPHEILRLESIARASWPALEVTLRDGWVIGSSGAYTRRANCVSPVKTGTTPLADHVEGAEAHYAARGQRPVFKMTTAAQPEGLDAFLDSKGYGRHSETLVMLLSDLPDSSAQRVADAGARGSSGAGAFHCEEGRPCGAWLDASYDFSELSPEVRSDYLAILDKLIADPVECAFGVCRVSGLIRSVALAVTCDGMTSLFQVATDPAFRGRGYADSVLRGLLSHAHSQGSTSAMLSVEAENAAARKLYHRLGFREVYRYWYREL